jgi:hypothetical protein
MADQSSARNRFHSARGRSGAQQGPQFPNAVAADARTRRWRGIAVRGRVGRPPISSINSGIAVPALLAANRRGHDDAVSGIMGTALGSPKLMTVGLRIAGLVWLNDARMRPAIDVGPSAALTRVTTRAMSCRRLAPRTTSASSGSSCGPSPPRQVASLAQPAWFRR